MVGRAHAVRGRPGGLDRSTPTSSTDDPRTLVSEYGKPDSDREITLASGNDKAEGIWGDAEHIWVAEDGSAGDNAVYAYDRSDGGVDSGVDLESSLLEATPPGNLDPHGLWSDGERMYVVDGEDAAVYAYVRSDQSYDAFGGVPLQAANDHAEGLWYDGRLLYVVDAEDDKVYTYALPRADSRVFWFGALTVKAPGADNRAVIGFFVAQQRRREPDAEHVQRHGRLHGDSPALRTCSGRPDDTSCFE